MSISYSIVTDWPFYRTAIARYRRQRPNRRRARIIATAFTVVLLAAWVYGRYSRASWVLIPQFALLGGIFGALGSFLVAKTLVPMRIKRSPSYGAAVSITLDDEGLHAVEPQARATLSWSAFTRVVRFGDGILFVRGSVMRWLPDSALHNSTPEGALTFVRSKTKVVDAG